MLSARNTQEPVSTRGAGQSNPFKPTRPVNGSASKGTAGEKAGSALAINKDEVNADTPSPQKINTRP